MNYSNLNMTKLPNNQQEVPKLYKYKPGSADIKNRDRWVKYLDAMTRMFSKGCSVVNPLFKQSKIVQIQSPVHN